MPIDANILLQGQGADLAGSVMRGAQAAQMIQQGPLLLEQQRLQNQFQQAQNQQAQYENQNREHIQQGQNVLATIQRIKPLVQAGNVTEAKNMILRSGMDADDVSQVSAFLTDHEGLSNLETSVNEALQTYSSAGKSAPTYGATPFYWQDAQGKMHASQLGSNGGALEIKFPEGAIITSDPASQQAARLATKLAEIDARKQASIDVHAANNPVMAPENRDALVNGIGNYEIDPSKALGAKDKKEVMGQVALKFGSKYDPTELQKRQRAENDFAAGKDSGTVRAFSAAMEHVQSLQDLIDGLDNGDVRIMNQLANQYNANIEGLPVVNAFNTVKTAVGSEVAKALIGSQTALKDREEWQSLIDSAQSPQALQAAITQIKHLGVAQINELERQYKRGTKKSGFGDEWIGPAGQFARAQVAAEKEALALSKKGGNEIKTAPISGESELEQLRKKHGL